MTEDTHTTVLSPPVRSSTLRRINSRTTVKGRIPRVVLPRRPRDGNRAAVGATPRAPDRCLTPGHRCITSEARLHDLRVIIHGTTDCWTRFRALSDAVKVSPPGRRISASQSNKRLLPRAGSTSRSTITTLETICTAIPSSGGLDRHMIRRSSCCHCQHTSEHRCRGSCAPAYCEGFVVGVVVVKWGMALLI